MGGTETHAGDSADMLLELACFRCIHGDVPGVVRPGSHFVDEHFPLFSDKELNGYKPYHV